MLYELIVDNEWIFEGTFAQCCEMAMNYDEDPYEIHATYIVSEEEFYGRR